MLSSEFNRRIDIIHRYFSHDRWLCHGEGSGDTFVTFTLSRYGLFMQRNATYEQSIKNLEY